LINGSAPSPLPSPAGGLRRHPEIERNFVMPAKAGIQKFLKMLDSASRFACAE